MSLRKTNPIKRNLEIPLKTVWNRQTLIVQVITNLYLFYPPLLHTPTRLSLDLPVSALDHDNSFIPWETFSGKRRIGQIGNFCCILAVKRDVRMAGDSRRAAPRFLFSRCGVQLGAFRTPFPPVSREGAGSAADASPVGCE